LDFTTVAKEISLFFFALKSSRSNQGNLSGAFKFTFFKGAILSIFDKIILIPDRESSESDLDIQTQNDDYAMPQSQEINSKLSLLSAQRHPNSGPGVSNLSSTIMHARQKPNISLSDLADISKIESKSEMMLVLKPQQGRTQMETDIYSEYENKLKTLSDTMLEELRGKPCQDLDELKGPSG